MLRSWYDGKIFTDWIVRSAQALGLHRDPRWRKWETMGQVESELRVLTWWLLASFDRYSSFSPSFILWVMVLKFWDPIDYTRSS